MHNQGVKHILKTSDLEFGGLKFLITGHCNRKDIYLPFVESSIDKPPITLADSNLTGIFNQGADLPCRRSQGRISPFVAAGVLILQ